MSNSRSTISFFVSALLIAGSAAVAWQISKPRAAKSSAAPAEAAEVHKVSEEELGTVRLTEDAAKRLGVEVGLLEVKPMQRARVYAGDVMIPAGRSITVAAPLGGKLAEPEGGVPVAGQIVKKGQPIFSLHPLLSPELRATFAAARADVQGQVENAGAQVIAAKLALDRAQRLYRDEAGSKRAVEEAQAQYDVASKTLEAAKARLVILTKAATDAAAGRSEPILIEAPETGLIRNVSALHEQSVPLGGTLFEVVDLAEVWLRVAVYVGDRDDIDLTASAAVSNLSAQPGAPAWPAQPVTAPPTANPAAATVDLYYQLDNRTAQLSPGQRMGVRLLLKGQGEHLCVPWSAVVHDIHGGTWIYVVRGERTYQRQRVVVHHVQGEVAVLERGPAAGTNVVTSGAIELFGAETGFSK